MTVSKSSCPKGALQNLGRSSGDDAVLHTTWICPGPLQGAAIAGVADGVAGWRQYGVDPGKLSRALCRTLQAEFRSGDCSKMVEPPTPVNLVRNAFSALRKRSDRYAGGSTLCFGVFNSLNGRIQLLNIGDSGWLILRNRKILAQSTASRYDQAPFQLAIVPPSLEDNALDFHKTPANPFWVERDTTGLKLQQFKLRHEDKIIFGTDGLFDNVHPNRIADLVNSGYTAEQILKEAYLNSLDPNFASPLAIRNFEEGKHNISGGKLDDIAVVLARVNEVTLGAG